MMGNNPHRGELALEAGGRQLTLQYTQNSLVELEGVLGMGIVKIINEMQAWTQDSERIRLSWVRALFWAGLIRHHPSITLEEAGELITEAGGLSAVLTVTGEAMQRAFNDDSAPDVVAETKGPRPPRNGTGADSSPTMSALGSRRRSSGTSRPGS
jgi:hypothetical protein